MTAVAKKNKIVLVGYMGSGKSSIGRLLAEKLQLPFFDLDLLIEEKAGKTVTETFADQGESKFRKMEAAQLKKWLNENKNGVLATGGGTPCHHNNMEMINRLSNSVYLITSVNELCKRLAGSLDRPLIKGKSPKEIKGFIRAHIKTRYPFYKQASIRVRSRGTLPKIVDRIISKL